MRLRHVLVVALLVLGARRATAQHEPDLDSASSVSAERTTPAARPPTRGWWHRPAAVTGWVATAQHSPFSTRLGTKAYRDFYMVGLRAAWPLWSGSDGDPLLRYFVDVIPLALTTDNPDYPASDDCTPGWVCPGAHPIPHTVYAGGLSPFGLSLRVVRVGPARLSVEGSAGALWFTRPVPDPDAERFNFTAAGGATLELELAPDRALRVRYFYHHTSNGGRGIVNPGLNSEMVAVGVEWR